MAATTPAEAKMKVVIVGGVAAGMTSAVRLRRLREDVDIHVFEKGPDISIASCGMPFYIGGEIKDRAKMALVNPTWAKARHNINVHTLTEVISVDRKAKTVSAKDLKTGEVTAHPYDKLVLSPGAYPVTAGIAGAGLPGVYTLRNLSDMDKITVEATGMKRAVVIGCGFVGVEVIEGLCNKGVQVTAVELAPQVLPVLDPEMVIPLQAAMENRGVKLLLSRKTLAIKEAQAGAQQGVPPLTVSLDDGSELPADFVILSIGVAPDSKIAKEAGLDVAPNGAIIVNDRMLTSDPDIYAAGDAVLTRNAVTCTPMTLPLAGPAVRQGRIVAANIAGMGNETFGGVIGTSVVKSFDITCASTGVSERMAKRCGMQQVAKLYLFQPTKVDWYPRSTPLLIKFIYNLADGKVLGCQVTGREGVEKRVDVVAVAIQAGMNVRQISQVELAYAPQFNGPKDPINVCGFVACNVLDGLSKLTFPDSLPPNHIILDVREEPELKLQGTVPGEIHIPCGQLRARLSELPKDKAIVVMCKVGARGNHVMRLLQRNGFDAYNLSGGVMVWNLFNNPAAYKTFLTNGLF